MREKRLVTKDLIPQFNTLTMRPGMERNDSVFLFQAGAHCKLRKKPVYIPMAFVGGAEETRTARRAPQTRNPRLPLRQQRGAKPSAEHSEAEGRGQHEGLRRPETRACR